MTHLTDGKVSVIVQMLFWDCESHEWIDNAATFFNANEGKRAYVEDVRKALDYAMDWALGVGDFFKDAGIVPLGNRTVNVWGVPF